MMANIRRQILQAMDIDAVKNNNTVRTLKSSARDFSIFCKSSGIRDFSSVTVKTVQDYADFLSDHYSAATVHTKLFGACRALHVSMKDIEKPIRASGDITRGRENDCNLQGKRELTMEKYKRLVDFQRGVGIRRAELQRLKPDCLVRDGAGVLCIRVDRGKGGKMQLQRILPGHEDRVLEILRESAGEKTVFSKIEMSNHINLHGIRAEVAREAYDYYAGRLAADPIYRKELIRELADRYRLYNKEGKNAGAVVRWVKSFAVGGEYRLRGDNKIKAFAEGRPVTYDRVALMAVSVFHLSHWRLDVTVTNYMV